MIGTSDSFVIAYHALYDSQLFMISRLCCMPLASGNRLCGLVWLERMRCKHWNSTLTGKVIYSASCAEGAVRGCLKNRFLLSSIDSDGTGTRFFPV